MPITNLLPARRSVEERNALVLEYQELIYWVWHRHKHESHLSRLGQEDAVAAGQLGLIRAAELYDPDRGEFVTYAPRWIYTAMQREAHRNQAIRVPDEVMRGQAPPECLADGEKVRHVARLNRHTHDRERAWEPALVHDPEPIWMQDGWEELQDALRFVHREEREPLLWHYRDGVKLAEIGERLGGLCRERVRQLIEKGMQRLCRRLRLRQVPTPGSVISMRRVNR